MISRMKIRIKFLLSLVIAIAPWEWVAALRGLCAMFIARCAVQSFAANSRFAIIAQWGASQYNLWARHLAHWARIGALGGAFGMGI